MSNIPLNTLTYGVRHVPFFKILFLFFQIIFIFSKIFLFFLFLKNFCQIIQYIYI